MRSIGCFALVRNGLKMMCDFEDFGLTELFGCYSAGCCFGSYKKESKTTMMLQVVNLKVKPSLKPSGA